MFIAERILELHASTYAFVAKLQRVGYVYNVAATATLQALTYDVVAKLQDEGKAARALVKATLHAPT
jgi:hypothetical protein